MNRSKRNSRESKSKSKTVLSAPPKRPKRAVLALNAEKLPFLRPTPLPALGDLLSMLRMPQHSRLEEPPSPNGFQLIEKKSDAKDTDSQSLLKTLMRNMFKADHPYRTRLGLSGELITSAAGLVNSNFAVSSLSSAQEWASIDALFDEFFVHSMTIKLAPYNRAGGGTSAAAVVGGTPTFSIVAGYAISAGLLMVSLFATAGTYSTAASMLSNPSVRHHMSDAPFSYAWRNNVRFDPRGISLTGSAVGWQGWSEISAVASIGGSLQVRCVNDKVLGDATHALTLGGYTLVFDVSFRSRA